MFEGTSGIVVVQFVGNTVYNSLLLQQTSAPAIILECNNVLFTTVRFPSQPVNYYLSSSSVPVLVPPTGVTFTAPSLSIMSYPYDALSANPGTTSLAMLQVNYNSSVGSAVTVGLTIETKSSQITSAILIDTNEVVGPGERATFFLRITTIPGLPLNSEPTITFKVSENCTSQLILAMLPVRVYNLVTVTATPTARSITILWIMDSAASSGYQLHIYSANGKDMLVNVNRLTTSYTITDLRPVESVYVTVSALGASNVVVARTGPVMYTTLEDGK